MARDKHRRVLLSAILAVVILVALALSITTYAVILPRLTDADRDAEAEIIHAHHAEYRICLRQMVTRAVMDADKHSDEEHLPLYDCTPNFHGHRARRLSSAQTKAFEHYVETTPRNQLP